jgi:hypothetical protein
MARQIFSLSSLLVGSCLLLASCAQQPTQAPAPVQAPAATEAPAAPSCPPIQIPVSASVPGEITKITVPAGSTAIFDPGTGIWCDTSQLKLNKVPLSGLVSTNGCFTDQNDKTYPCSIYNALAAVDIQPSRIKFLSSPWPVLVFDLSKTESQPYCTEKGPNCGGYAIYKLKNPVSSAPSLAWRYISPATLISGSTPAGVEAKSIDHFSTFALVELPPPQLFPPVITAEMTVASEFILAEPDSSNVFLAAFLIRDDTLGMNGQTRLLRFSYPEMQLSVNGAYPAECLDTKIYPDVSEQLSCLFPVDMEVILVNGVDDVAYQISITPATGEYEARLFADLEVH